MFIFSVNRRKNIWGDLGKLDLFYKQGKVAQNGTCGHTIFGPAFERRKLGLFNGVSHRGVSRDETGELGP